MYGSHRWTSWDVLPLVPEAKPHRSTRAVAKPRHATSRATPAPTTPPPTTRTSNGSCRIRSRFAARVRAENSVTAIPSRGSPGSGSRAGRAPGSGPEGRRSRYLRHATPAVRPIVRPRWREMNRPIKTFLRGRIPRGSQRINLGGTMGPHREGTGTIVGREAILKVLEAYDPSAIRIATIGSHSALDVCDGAVEEGFPTLVVCEKGRATPYARYFHAARA